MDLDGDGDLDVLSASACDDKIAWYENLDGAGNFGAQHGDLDPRRWRHVRLTRRIWTATGRLDVLSASPTDDKIAWYENLDGAGSFGVQQVISDAGRRCRSVRVRGGPGRRRGRGRRFSASRDDDKIAWYENGRGRAFGNASAQ